MSVTIKKKEYEVQEELDENSAVVTRKGKTYFFKDYSEDEEAYKKWDKTYDRLRNTGIRYPKVFVNDNKQRKILMEYIPGETCLDTLMKGDLDDDTYEEIFLMACYARHENYTLDYDPSCFKMYKGKMYYLGFRLYPYEEKDAFQLSGIRWWVYTKDLVELLKKKDLPQDLSRLKPEFETNKDVVLLTVKHYR
ncbi:MAG: hypothetical protein LUD22_03205 [Coprobacillus sp.]|nr:hypothetical protein [Coprobacillus sp.]